MGFGALIASGKDGRLLREDLVDCITEVRVEQSLDDPTRFAIRFQEDISGGEPRIMTAEELQCERMITIAVKAGDEIKCLVRGPITDVASSVMLGGPGSWYEVRGEDRRIELDRQCFRKRWSGRASEIAETILSQKFGTNVQKTNVVYGGRRSHGRELLETLNQRSTDLAFIRLVARQNNLHFWIEYDCQARADSVEVRETANLKSSPPRTNGGSASSDQLQLVPTVPVKLRVNVEKERCPNVTSFTFNMNPERPNRFEGMAVDDRDVREHRTSVTDPQPTIRRGGRRFAGCQAQRDVCIATAGNQDELQIKAESALTEAGWFVDATANTTMHMLGGVLLPHDIVEVEGLGSKHSGPYQVKAVTHVINAADHFMDVQLRRNSIGGD